MAKAGRPEKLTAEDRTSILAILWAGGTPRLAARYVGCTVKTINKTMKEDPEFAAEVRKKQESSEVAYLGNIRKAAEEVRYWRAAAWALERIDPRRYAARQPDVVTFPQIRRLMVQLADVINAEVPEEHRDKILQRLTDICGSLESRSKKGTRSHGT